MTIDKDGLASLLERVREAKGPDRELDRDIQKALDIGPTSFTQDEFNHWPLHVTASIDASLALVERLLPGSCVYPDITPGNHACGLRYGSQARDTCFETAATPPLAILAALLTALKEVR